MASDAATTRLYQDIATSFEAGMNQGITPSLLPKNQLAFALNASVRGGNVGPRPPFIAQNFFFGEGDTEALETSFLKGKFQGAGIYRPDFGPTQIIVQISGRIFSMTPRAEDWLIADISIADDLNDPNTAQVWMWQSEKWLIIQNGLVLPIFYDGVSCRRSFGPSEIIATVNSASPGSPPEIGETIVATLAATYDGPYNVPVLFNGAFYQPVNLSSALYYLSLQRIVVPSGTNGSPPAQGTPVYAIPSALGPVAAYNSNADWATENGWSFTAYANAVSSYAVSGIVTSPPGPSPIRETITNFQVPLNIDLRLNVGDNITFANKTWEVRQIHNVTTVRIARLLSNADWVAQGSPASTNYAAGTLAYVVGNNSPTVLIGTVQAVTSSSGDDFVVTIDKEYPGDLNQPVYLGTTNPSLYIANPGPVDPPVGTDVTLINLNDTGTDPYTVPQDILSVPELPAGRMGAYGMGRNWVSLIDGISYVAGDIVGGAAGTSATNYRDAVLKMTENDFLAGGGSFRLPGSGNVINSMTFTANLDASQGQGPLQIGTDIGLFSNNTPTDRDTWANLSNPILTQSLIGAGPLSQNATCLSNSDIMFRSNEGLGSLIIARRDFNSWGNTSISHEVQPLLQIDQRNLLVFGSAAVADNRYVITFSPFPGSNGIYHRGLVAINFDTVSTMGRKSAPVYDGMWTGVNVLQILQGNFSGEQKTYALTFNATDEEIQLHELARSYTGKLFDDGTERITWVIETPIFFGGDVKPLSELVRLMDGEIYLQEIAGQVNIKVEYRPDFYPCWVLWRENIELCADITQDNSKYGYKTRASFGEPSTTACEASNDNRSLNVGHFFQIRLTFTGNCKLAALRLQASTNPVPNFAAPVCAPTCDVEIPMP